MFLGSYQIEPLTAALMKMPTSLPLTVPRLIQSCAYSVLSAFMSTALDRSSTLPALASSAIWPGPGRPARSGGLPPWVRVVRTAFRSRVPSYWTWTPVASWNGLTMAMKLSCSSPVQVPSTVTVPPIWVSGGRGTAATVPPAGDGLAAAAGDAAGDAAGLAAAADGLAAAAAAGLAA